MKPKRYKVWHDGNEWCCGDGGFGWSTGATADEAIENHRAYEEQVAAVSRHYQGKCDATACELCAEKPGTRGLCK